MRSYHYSDNGTLAIVSTTAVDPADRDHDEVIVTAHIKGSDVPDALRYRSIYIPAALIFGGANATLNGEPSLALEELLRASILELARARFKDDLGEDRSSRNVPVENYTLAGLLAWNTETAASRGSISFTKEQALAWFSTSTLAEKLAAKNPKAHGAIKARIAALAAKNHGIRTSGDANAILALIPSEDAARGIGADIVGRLAHIAATLAEKEASESLDFSSITLD